MNREFLEEKLAQLPLYIYDFIDPSELEFRRVLFRSDPEKIRPLLDHDVADPWYTGDFSATWNDIEEGCRKILEELDRKSVV